MEKRIEREEANTESRRGNKKMSVLAQGYEKQYGKKHNMSTERGENQYKTKANRHMMLTMSPNKETSRSHLMDPSKAHQIKQIELYQKNAK